MTERIEKELEHLRRYYPQAMWHPTGQNGWVKIPDFPIPSEIWNKDKATVGFEVPVGYPGQAPYAFYVEGGLRLKSNVAKADRYNEPVTTPFPGTWGKFSWSHEGTWRPSADVTSGDNLANFAHTFHDRLREGK
jgi:hypothetical protein